ncbi:Pectinesterase [Melia azedarach]|uniref:Pectinesterase n=1 Tax=Melia azedarach TaxID=155640 RepID=A0ACC1XLE5_MELAZ|nr:Pectinesterase [Melia azedarach]
MDAVNVIKGYNKVNPGHENIPPPPHKRLKAAVIISAFVLLTLIIGLMTAAAVHVGRESKESPVSLSSNSDDLIKKLCSVTRYPDLCFTSISSSPNVSTETNPDAEFIFKLSLEVSMKELRNVSSSIKTLSDRLPSQAALVDCMGQLDDALSRLKDSMAETETDDELTERKVNDIQTWISAGMSDEESCLDGLTEMGSTAVDEVRSMMEKSKKLLSNSLAIIANIRTILHMVSMGRCNCKAICKSMM